jgi:hypothetical protein
MKKTLLIGNGINCAIKGNGVSWENLLSKLSKKFAMGVALSNEHIPFPLTFEEIIFVNPSRSFDYKAKVKSIKEKIADTFKIAEPNTFHEKIMNNTNIEHILTTNYEYCFEKVFIPGFANDKVRLPNTTLETKHSLRRRNCISYNGIQKSIWHIHGEINHNQKFNKDQYPSMSIQIGYEQYGEYLYEIQSYVNGKKIKDDESIPKKLLNGIDKPNSWIDLLFTDYVIITGLSLDFSEIDLWWLFNYRKKVFSSNKNLTENIIKFYYPSLPRDVIDDDEKRIRLDIKYEKKSAIATMLETLGIQTNEILCDNYEDFYRKVFNEEKI